jgi:hypothetical protein
LSIGWNREVSTPFPITLTFAAGVPSDRAMRRKSGLTQMRWTHAARLRSSRGRIAGRPGNTLRSVPRAERITGISISRPSIHAATPSGYR